MLQNILNLNGAQELSKTEQQTIVGGGGKCNPLPEERHCNSNADCPWGYECSPFNACVCANP